MIGSNQSSIRLNLPFFSKCGVDICSHTSVFLPCSSISVLYDHASHVMHPFLLVMPCNMIMSQGNNCVVACAAFLLQIDQFVRMIIGEVSVGVA